VAITCCIELSAFNSITYRSARWSNVTMALLLKLLIFFSGLYINLWTPETNSDNDVGMKKSQNNVKTNQNAVIELGSDQVLGHIRLFATVWSRPTCINSYQNAILLVCWQPSLDHIHATSLTLNPLSLSAILHWSFIIPAILGTVNFACIGHICEYLKQALTSGKVRDINQICLQIFNELHK